jgi:hypothetical protein
MEGKSKANSSMSMRIGSIDRKDSPKVKQSFDGSNGARVREEDHSNRMSNRKVDFINLTPPRAVKESDDQMHS